MAAPVAAALHELRRPLQTAMLALAGRGPTDRALACLGQAAAALEQLEHELGLRAEPPRADGGRTAARELLADARRRWPGLDCHPIDAGPGERGAGAGSPELELPGDRRALGAALDNLIANALEHGGGGARVELRPGRDGVCLIVANPPGAPGGGPPVAGRGLGLGIVERTAEQLGGAFERPRRIGPEVVSRLRLPDAGGASR